MLSWFQVYLRYMLLETEGVPISRRLRAPLVRIRRQEAGRWQGRSWRSRLTGTLSASGAGEQSEQVAPTSSSESGSGKFVPVPVIAMMIEVSRGHRTRSLGWKVPVRVVTVERKVRIFRSGCRGAPRSVGNWMPVLCCRRDRDVPVGQVAVQLDVWSRRGGKVGRGKAVGREDGAVLKKPC